MVKTLFKDKKIRLLLTESWSLSWPMAIIMFFEFLIGLSDVYVAGRFGEHIQAAYGLAFQMYFVFIFVGIAISVGTVSAVSRIFTSDNKAEFSIAAVSALALSCAAGIIFGIAGFSLAGPIISIFNVPPSVRSAAIALLRIYSLGFLFDYLLITINAILRSSGMIKKSLLAMMIACLLNVPLNFILAFGTPLGAQGIAWATVISLFIGTMIAGYYLRGLITSWRGISTAIIKKIISISWPSGVLQILWQLGSAALFLILGALPLHKVEIMAALTNGLKIESAIFLPAFAFSMANAVIVGNLLGKKEREDAFKAGIVTALLGVSVVIVITMFVMLNARHIASFLSPNSIVVDECVRYIYIALLSEPVMAWAVILGGGLNGAGDTKGVMIIVSMSVWLVRIPCAYIFGIFTGFGAPAIWWCMNLSIMAHAILITRRYAARRWAH